MTVTVNGLPEKERRSLHEGYADIFLNGECYLMATALNEGLGWPLVGLMDGEIVVHAGVRAPDGSVVDVRGYSSEEEFARPYRLPPPYVFKNVTPRDMFREDYTDDFAAMLRYRIVSVRRLAEIVLPDLPWKASLKQKMNLFANELEELCRRHKIMVHDSCAGRPVISVIDDDDTEPIYRLDPTLDGHHYLLTRTL